MRAPWQFGSLRTFGYDVIACDPPWDFELYSEAGEGKSAKAHYATMPLAQIEALRVGDLARGDCLLLLWCCEWIPPAARQRVLDAWGFTYKTTIVWRKTTPAGKVRMGPGYRARTMHEPVLIATAGNPRHTAFPSIFDGIAREHSRKPEEFFAMVEKVAPHAARADLFSRQRRHGWDGWGNEADKFDASEQKVAAE
ncbi:MT-A70 family methyltransferase [Aquabacter sp. CN5-332]|uniref:MT-A70 family methyltransferase n=1 Tax=Aquabacter sp. CN5-332 TaxID=3156608 RepID=UPI0032B3E29D